ncbi:MAG: Gfo/Idh/MocA family protein [Anaerolineales bacterium]
MADRINWGILGTGRIATKFAQGLASAPQAKLLAVGSRAETSASEFAKRFDIPRPYTGYETLVADPDLDVIYVSSPHALHFEHTLLALQAGKPVLCEKPFTLNEAEVKQLVDEARQRDLFLMEGMWTRFFPLMDTLQALISEGALGELQMLAADLGIRRTIETRERLFRPDLGGGALLDVGVYPVSFASLLFGEPERIESMAQFGTYGVDERAGVLLGYSNGALASIYMAIRTETPQEAILLGTQGMIRIHANFVIPTRMTVSIQGEPDRVIEEPLVGNGMHYEAEEVMRCLKQGWRESPRMPLDESVSVMRTLDRIREQWNFHYPSELNSQEIGE